MRQKEISKQYLFWEGQKITASDSEMLYALLQTTVDKALCAFFSFLSEWFSDVPYVDVQTSGSTGKPKKMQARKTHMIHSACMTCDTLHLAEGETLLLAMDLRYIGAKMMVVRALVSGLNVIVRQASGHPLSDVTVPVQFLSMVPIQLYNTLQVAAQKEQLCRARVVIIGGGAVEESLRISLQDLPCRVYSTYGMTETLSHVAMRTLNGPEASDRYYPLGNIKITLSALGTLQIEAPDICDQMLITNDIGCLYNDGSFVLLGRKDNIINSGGVKIQIETDERLLKDVLKDCDFALTYVPDARLGQAVVLLLQAGTAYNKPALRKTLLHALPPYHQPQYIVEVAEIPHTNNGKIDRSACRRIALEQKNK